MKLLALVAVLLLAAGSALARPEGDCASRGNTIDECTGGKDSAQQCDADNPGKMCVLCGDGDDKQCTSWDNVESSGCDHFTFECYKQGGGVTKYDCNDVFCDAAGGGFTEVNGFKNEIYCYCSSVSKVQVLPLLGLGLVAMAVLAL
jgi:hypothetical protein